MRVTELTLQQKQNEINWLKQRLQSSISDHQKELKAREYKFKNYIENKKSENKKIIHIAKELKRELEDEKAKVQKF